MFSRALISQNKTFVIVTFTNPLPTSSSNNDPSTHTTEKPSRRLHSAFLFRRVTFQGNIQQQRKYTATEGTNSITEMNQLGLLFHKQSMRNIRVKKTARSMKERDKVNRISDSRQQKVIMEQQNL